MEVADRIKIPSWVWSCAKIAGSGLFIAACVFVARQFLVYWEDLHNHTITGKAWITGLLVSIAYASLNLLLALGWLKILGGLGAKVNSFAVIRIYALSQLAKYVPGNIFQFAGRHVLAEGSGLAHSTLAKSTLIELVALVTGGILCLPLILPYLMPSFPGWVKAALFVLPVLFLLYFLNKHLGQAFMKAMACYLSFLVSTGICFAIIFIIVAEGAASISSVAFFAGAFVVAWLAGLVTPGAPAGLGMREAVLTLLLANFAPASTILLAVLVSRITTLTGDFMFFGSAFFMDLKKSEHSCERAENTKVCNE